MGPARGDAHRLGPHDLTVERLGYWSKTAANLPQDGDFPRSALELIEQPGWQQRQQRGSACVQQHAELTGLEVDSGKLVTHLEEQLAAGAIEPGCVRPSPGRADRVSC